MRSNPFSVMSARALEEFNSRIHPVLHREGHVYPEPVKTDVTTLA
jgi:hypothetical protein